MNTFINITLLEDDFDGFADTDIPATQQEQQERILAAVTAAFPDAEVSIDRQQQMEREIVVSVNSSEHGIGTRGNEQGDEDEEAAETIKSRVEAICDSIDEDSADWAVEA